MSIPSAEGMSPAEQPKTVDYKAIAKRRDPNNKKDDFDRLSPEARNKLQAGNGDFYDASLQTFTGTPLDTEQSRTLKNGFIQELQIQGIKRTDPDLPLGELFVAYLEANGIPKALPQDKAGDSVGVAAPTIAEAIASTFAGPMYGAVFPEYQSPAAVDKEDIAQVIAQGKKGTPREFLQQIKKRNKGLDELVQEQRQAPHSGNELFTAIMNSENQQPLTDRLGPFPPIDGAPLPPNLENRE